MEFDTYIPVIGDRGPEPSNPLRNPGDSLVRSEKLNLKTAAQAMPGVLDDSMSPPLFRVAAINM